MIWKSIWKSKVPNRVTYLFNFFFLGLLFFFFDKYQIDTIASLGKILTANNLRKKYFILGELVLYVQGR